MEMVLEELLEGKWIIECHEAWLKAAITISLAKRLAGKNEALPVIDYLGILYRIEASLPENIVLLTHPVQDIDRLVIIEPRTIKTYHILPENTVILTSPRTIRRLPRDWFKAKIKRVTGHEYIIQGDINERIVLLNNLEIKTVEAPPGIKGEALEILRNAIIDYGELTIKDATIILAHELGINKGEAREILVELARKRYIRVEHGHVYPL